MKTDEILQQDVHDALQREPHSATSTISVISTKGVITLTGRVANYPKKTEAGNIANKVVGVKIVRNNIDVIINSWEEKNDIEIAAEIRTIFRWNWNTLHETITVKVIKGWVTLSGEVAWNYQKEAAKEAISNLIGVKGVSNSITIKAQHDTEIDQASLRRALQNHHALDSEAIAVVVSKATITLKGSVETWYQKELAGRIAWKATGVCHVANELLIEE